MLRTLFALIHPDEFDEFSNLCVGDLTQQVNLFLLAAGERWRLLPRKVGAVLKSLGFSTRKRTNSGWVISLSRQDAEKLHQLAACYGIDGFKDRFFGISLENCSLCQAAGLKPYLPTVLPGEEVSTKPIHDMLARLAPEPHRLRRILRSAGLG